MKGIDRKERREEVRQVDGGKRMGRRDTYTWGKHRKERRVTIVERKRIGRDKEGEKGGREASG